MILRRRSGYGVWVIAGLGLALLGGCGAPKKLRAPERFGNGYVIVLPGIEGSSPFNANIARGLADGGVGAAVEVYDWTAGSLMFGLNLRHLERNRQEARSIARKIMDYLDKYPGKPVHLIGHSGGGGIAVLTLEALPPERSVSSAILLAAAIAPDYDLRRAMRRTDFGIYNFYSPYDVGWLRMGTTIMGTIDGKHTSAAGATGFTVPWGIDGEGRQLYGRKLRQHRYDSRMMESGHVGGHFGWADRGFVSEWLAPIIRSQDGAAARFATDQNDNPGGSRGRFGFTE